jgi:oxalate---CoA ligase
MDTVLKIMESGSGSDPALCAPGRASLSYAGLRLQVERTRAALADFGIGAGDRVAIVLPNGPEAATAFLGVAGCSVAAPLNPNYKAPEFDFYLSDLKAKAVIVEQGSASPVIDVARQHGAIVLEAAWVPTDPAGVFELIGDTDGAGIALAPPRPQDEALVLHTSGTTARPKIVPLSHLNLATSARNVAATLSLSPEDRCLNLMPLFHIHGLVAVILGSLIPGASTFCCPAFNPLKVFSWLDESDATWYSAVPTFHQTILARAGRNPKVVERANLRFIRSSSASLPPTVMAELEALFGAPVVEAYGMTEAAHQMACNPLPPGERKPGTVGPAAGPDVAIMDQVGTLLDAGSTGEIVIRGANVFKGYENNPEANGTAFSDGWFRTGDQGVMDPVGYVTITGRLKEIINRGGEKIAPREVDEALMEHPAVAQVVAFGVPDPTLGETVGAAIVLRSDATATVSEIREFARERLASFKVPKTVLFIDEIPKGATGKLQRIGLAEKLGLV